MAFAPSGPLGADRQRPDLGGLRGAALGLSQATVDLSLPRFDITLQSTSLIPQLQALGMTDAFESGVADLSNMFAGGQPAYIGSVDHAALFQVDEQGTLAAAVTVVGVSASAGVWPPPTVVPFDADRPFLFFLRDTDTGAVLFAGRLTDAAAAAPSS